MDKDDSPFGVYITRPKLTRKQKCENCQKHKEVPDILCSLKDISMEQLQNLQKIVATLEKIRQVASTNPDGNSSQQFYEKDGLLYRWWMPPHYCSDDMTVEQLILPVQCQHGVLQLTYSYVLFL